MSEGHVYIVRAGGRYKIGMANDPTKRIKTLQTGSPDVIQPVFVAKVEEPSVAEKRLHSLLATKRGSGEWFELKAEDVDTCISVLSSEFQAVPVVIQAQPEAFDLDKGRIQATSVGLKTGEVNALDVVSAKNGLNRNALMRLIIREWLVRYQAGEVSLDQYRETVTVTKWVLPR